MSERTTLRVCALYPDLMNIYADRGNLLLLQRRCEWRGIGFELRALGLGEPLGRAGEEADLFYIGGGQDRDQRLCALDLAEVKREGLHGAVARGAALLAVCGGYQLLGHSYEMNEETLPGVGLVDLRTVRSDGPRLIGNVAIEVDLDGQKRVLAGFENHGGRTHLGPGARPLGRVLRGHGNNDADGFEGVRQGNVVGTYLHGPLLPKNVWLADWLIARALGGDQPLGPLDDAFEAAAHAEARRAAGV
jgi:CobQ-like glutamine amidotransferase family enzyme